MSHANVMADTELRTGNVRWQIPLSGITSPWPAGDVVYAVGLDGAIVCAARDSGQLYWLADLNAPGARREGQEAAEALPRVWSSPILANNRLIMVSDTGEAVALDAKTGRGAAANQARRRRASRPDRGLAARSTWSPKAPT